jgi:hypothetical protein
MEGVKELGNPLDVSEPSSRLATVGRVSVEGETYVA